MNTEFAKRKMCIKKRPTSCYSFVLQICGYLSYILTNVKVLQTFSLSLNSSLFLIVVFTKSYRIYIVTIFLNCEHFWGHVVKLDTNLVQRWT